ncbi:MAG: DNA cytosine methyltransferase [Treponema sp.]|jgi:DNA (cytosine-5)-methyltransferase 1|nr:DNA cytosine methyltransferase [Treponema sp.]
MKKNFVVVDMFCGAGGESTGIMQAAQEQGMKVSLTAINHWERAIETHAANHPSAEHWCQSVEQLDPTEVIKKQKVNLLWASPECTHHSIARGGRPRSDQSRASAWLILKWLSELYVERVIIENVPEFLSWGPLDSTGRPVQSKKGKIFKAFIASLQSLGYTVDWKILCAADYGDPTTRRRLFVQAVKGRKRIVWPQITHIDGDGDNLMGYQSWRPARDIIDWSIQGTSIFDRKKPLADATIRRIAAGIEKYWGDYAKPFLAVLYGSNDVRSLDLPLPSVTTSGAHHAIIEPVPLLIGHQSGQGARPIDQPVQTILAQGRVNLIQALILGQQSGAAARPVDQPIPTVATAGAISVIQPFLTRYQGDHEGQQDGGNRNHELKRPLPTVDTSNRYALVEPFLIDNHTNGTPNKIENPLSAVTTKGWFGLIESFLLPNEGFYRGNKAKSLDEPLGAVTASRGYGGIVSPLLDGVKLDIRFRMLKNHELKRAQGFPEDYKITGNITEQTKQIGNAVPVNTAKALALAAMAG